MIEQPLPTRVAIVETRWKPVLGRKSILRGHNGNPEFFNHPSAELIIEGGRQSDIAATMNPEHDGIRSLVDRLVDFAPLVPVIDPPCLHARIAFKLKKASYKRNRSQAAPPQSCVIREVRKPA